MFDETGALSGLLTAIVKIVAYVAPFFLIPATFKVGFGVFGNLAGMINDRSRGVFDRQRKRRADIRSRETAKARAGERFNNRGLNALTSRASTRSAGFGGRGKAAYQQKLANSSYDFGKSAEGQAVQHNDDALRALTYGSAIEAKQNMKKDFGMSDDAIERSIAAAQASGGFGRNRQLFAAAQLSRTGTGYDDLQQVTQTIARVSHGNTGQASALAGDINASTKQAGRYDLAPGFGTLNSLAQAEMDTSTPGPNMAEYHAATVQAARGVDGVSLLRGKPKQVKQLTQSLVDHADAQRLVMANSTAGSAAHSKAQDEFLQTMGQIDQLNQSKSYASAENQEHVNKMMNDTQQLRTQEIDKILGRTYDTAGNRTDTLVVPGSGGPVRTNLPGAGVTQQQIDARERYDQTRAPRMNPNDPNNQS